MNKLWLDVLPSSNSCYPSSNIITEGEATGYPSGNIITEGETWYGINFLIPQTFVFIIYSIKD